jgi:hypothetical protein
MIQVHCAACDAEFEVGDESAGLTEFCPACGSLNDIPQIEEIDSSTDADATIAPPVEAAALTEMPANSRGVPAPLWWTLIIAGIGAFVVACVFMFSDNWESRHVQELSDAANRGDVLMADADYAGAAREYQSVLDIVGSRTIESTFIQSLIDRSRRGEADAQARLRAAPTSAPSTTEPAQALAATEPDEHDLVAMRIFQRQSEALSEYVHVHPVVFQEPGGPWRRRQFTVWDVTYEQHTDAKPPEIVLQYSCASSTTAAHEDRFDATADTNFNNDEGPSIIHCNAWCEEISGRWRVIRQESDASSTSPRMNEIFELVRHAFDRPLAGSELGPR